MPRKILFRGKRQNNGEFVSGSIVSFDDGSQAIFLSTAPVFKQRGTTTFCCNACYDVDPSTVGQYTGLTDKNGARIFEGDILCVQKGGDPCGKIPPVYGVVKFDASAMNRAGILVSLLRGWTTIMAIIV